jgi:mono/diheme cytochrome c family protein
MSMRQSWNWTMALCLVVVLAGTPAESSAAPTPAQKKELGQLVSELNKVRGLITRKKFDEADAAINDSLQKLDQLIKDAGFAEDDPLVRKARQTLETQQANLAKAKGGPGAAKDGDSVSFVKDVAPILADRCLGCHGADSNNGLKLDSYASMEQGGRNGPLARPGNPSGSLLMQRVVHVNPQYRMPRNAAALQPSQIGVLATWIANGAKFDGADKSTALTLLAANPAAATEKVEVAMATGTETVSFVKDIAPALVGTCGNCHGGNNPRGGLSLANFVGLMAGGESGKVIVPGDVEGSRFFQVLRDGEMPQGAMARITREWYADVQTWIKEGAKFDGKDPKAPLRELIPTADQLKAEELAKLTPAQWEAKRRDDAFGLWKQTFPQSDEPDVVPSDHLLVVGDASPARLKEVADWGEQQITVLKELFDVKDDVLWKGKLSVLVFKDRFGFEEFNNTVYRRQVPAEVTGQSEVSMGQDRALVAVQDLGDDSRADSPGFRLSVVEHVTGAFLKRRGTQFPDWLTRGAGLAVVFAKSGGGDPYLGGLRGRAAAVLRESNLTDPAAVFSAGQFSPGDVGPVGFALVDFLLKEGGAGKFGQLVQRLEDGTSSDAALRAVYGVDPARLGVAFAGSIANAPGSKAKPKK